MLNEYDAQETFIVARHLPPRHFKLSYLITAWTQRPEDEHRLLSSLLMCFLRFDALPADLLTGPLGALGLPVPVTVALPPPEDRAFADVDRKSTRLNSSHANISYAVFCLKKKNN